MPVTAGERIAATLVSFLATAIIAAYAMDWIGLTILPLAALAASVVAALAVFIRLRPHGSDRTDAIALLGIVAVMLAWLLWLARPSWLPIGTGPDLTHHLALIDYIERHWRLPHDPQLGALLGEMVNYTPGLHLLAALAGAWTRTDGLHTVYTIVALTVALKAGLVFLIARRMMPDGVPRTPLAMTAMLLLFVPREYVLGSFAELSFLAQVASEMFAMAMWLAIVVWNDRPSAAVAALVALTSIATFLTWPVWVGPVLLVWVVVVASQPSVTLSVRLQHLAVAVLPLAAVAAVHAAGRVHALVIVAGAGYVAYPTVALFGWGFLLPAAAGAIAAAFYRRGRTVPLLLAAIALQSASFYVVATRAGADRPYFALKMVYLAIYPAAIAASVMLATIARALQIRDGERGHERAALQARLMWIPVALLAVAVARPLVRAPRPKPAVSQPMFLAGRWARASLPRDCVDYLVESDASAYWLHIAVLGHARADARTRRAETFDPQEALFRWIQPEGLPFAITNDFDGLPKDIRTSVDIAERFGPAAIVKRRGKSVCGSNPQ